LAAEFRAKLIPIIFLAGDGASKLPPEWSTNPIIGKPLNREATSAAADRLRGKIARWLVRASDAGRAPPLAVVRFSRMALRSICRTLLPGVGVLIKLPALGIEGAAAGILPPTTFCSRFVDRTADCKAETASLALTSLQRRAQVRQRRSKARVSVEHAAT
jgi:hypothetical protein